MLPVADLAVAEAFHSDLGFDIQRHDARYAWARSGGDELYHLAVVDDLDVARNAAGLFLFTRDLDAWHARAVAAVTAAGDLARGDATAIRQEPWGMREFAVTDPSGNRLRLGWFSDAPGDD